MSTPRERILFFGGTSDERLVSVASAQKLAPALGEATYWFLSPEGGVHPCSKQELLGHQRPFEFPFLPDAPEAFRELEPALVEAKHAGSVLVLAFHGGAEEDGRFQLECERSGVKFTGSGSASSAVAFDKQAAKRRVAGYGIPVAEEIVLVSGESPEAAIALLEREGELILKPRSGGSSVGLFHVTDLASFHDAYARLPRVPYLAEAFLRGRELTVGVYDGEDGLVGLPPSEVKLEAGVDLDYEAKYLGRGCQEITPADLTKEEIAEAHRLAIASHEALGCYGYSRTDFILTEKGLVYLETNTLPGLTPASFYPVQLEVAGIALSTFLDRQIELAKQR